MSAASPSVTAMAEVPASRPPLHRVRLGDQQVGRPVRRVPGVGLGRRGRDAGPAGHGHARSPRPRCRSARSTSATPRSGPAACPSSTACSAAVSCPGAAILLAGEPGVGKSTLLLEVAAQTASIRRRTLYVTGEESASQVRLRADRTGGVHDELFLAAETDLGAVLSHIEEVRPSLLVVDSIQTISAAGLDATPGGVSHVKEVAAALIRVAKTRNITTVIVGHVTKDGTIAGPRVLEHVVDVVLHFEGDRNSRFRMLRAMKNRFGPVDEVGCFDLSAEGIAAVTDPTGLFVQHHDHQVPGTCVAVTHGGPAADARRGAGAGDAVGGRTPTTYDVRARRLAGRHGPRRAAAALRRAAPHPRRLRLDRRRRAGPRARQRPGRRGRARLGHPGRSGAAGRGGDGRDRPGRRAASGPRHAPADRRGRPARFRGGGGADRAGRAASPPCRAPSTASGCSRCPTWPRPCACWA